MKMAKLKKTLVWSVIHGKGHPSLTEDEGKISGIMPVINTLFPGINYYSISGFNQVTRDYAQPVLKKLFPELKDLDAKSIREDETLQVGVFLPSKGYEHLDSPEWREKLDGLLKK